MLLRVIDKSSSALWWVNTGNTFTPWQQMATSFLFDLHQLILTSYQLYLTSAAFVHQESFICKIEALRTAAESITRKNLYKIQTKGFLFVSFYRKSSPLVIGLYGNWLTVYLHSEWGIYCPRRRLVQYLISEYLIWIIILNGLFKSLHSTVLRSRLATILQTNYNLNPAYSNDHWFRHCYYRLS